MNFHLRSGSRLAVLLGLSLPSMNALAQSPSRATINLAQPPADLNVTPMPVKVVEAYPNLRIDRPIVITGAGDGSGRLFIASQKGPVFWINQSDTNVEEPKPFIDLSDRVSYKDRENEEGLLGMAFHPKFKENGFFYVYYTTTQRPHVSIISRFTASGDNHSVGDPSSEVELMRIQQPFWNHNGGTILFGPDGYLYIGLGDGGKGNDPLQSGQDLSKLLGSVLRIDVDGTSDKAPYRIPADNPFVNTADAWPEIYAYGIRNIWRMAFDPKTQDLYAADVGQNEWEEVNIITRGGNYGWSLREGAHRFTLGGLKGSDARPDLIEPLIEYPHTDDWGKSVTGGAVYRGKSTPALDGYYLYGDYVTGRLWAMKFDRDANKVVENRPIAWNQLPVFTFGQTDDGEVLMSTMMSGGVIYRFAAN
ncbi:MAG: PQQ-dependent sugar dehydrogenase [Planctomycetaceae bacterium]